MNKDPHRYDGSVFGKRPVSPPTKHELEELFALKPVRDEVSECEEIGLKVLRDYFGPDVRLGDHNEPHNDEGVIYYPLPGKCREIVLDAFDLLADCQSARALETALSDSAFAEYYTEFVRNYGNTMHRLGRLRLCIELRLEKVEWFVGIGKPKDIGSKPQYPIEDYPGAADAIRQWLGRTEGVSRRGLERRFEVSKSVIERWAKEVTEQSR